MKSGETGVVILEHDIEMTNVSEVIITLSSVAGTIEKRLSQHEVEIKSNNKILIPLSQDDTLRLSRKTDTEVKVEGQIVFNDTPPTVCKTDIVSFRLGATLNTERVPAANGSEGQYNAVTVRCHAGVIYANVDPGDVENLVEQKLSEALANSEVISGKDGKDGVDGKSAYELAVENGFTGTVEEWLDSLKGEPGGGGAVDPSVITDAVNDYLDEHPVSEVTMEELASQPIEPPTTKVGVYKQKFGNCTVTQKANNVVGVSNPTTEMGGALFEVEINPNIENVFTFSYKNIVTESNDLFINIYVWVNGYKKLGDTRTVGKADQTLEVVLSPDVIAEKGVTSPVIIGLISNRIATYDISVTNKYGDNTTVSTLKKDVVDLKAKKQLIGKKAIFLGDSITALTDDRSWVEKFCALTGVTKVANVAVSSATMTDKSGTVLDGNPTSSNAANNTLANQVQKIINNQYEAPDLIIIAIGTNSGIFAVDTSVKASYVDSNNELVPLENLNRTASEGAFRWANETLHNLYPNAIICWCNPIQAAHGLRENSSVVNWANALRTLTNYGGVINIETNRCGIMMANEINGAEGEDLKDGLHPNANGAMKMARYNAAAISNLF